MGQKVETMPGGCACGANRYRVLAPPMAINVCHCLDCQRLSGSAFAVNIWIESSNFEHWSGSVASHTVDSGSGTGHEISWCQRCGNYLWGRYLAAPEGCLFVKAGTLDDPSVVAPTAHIYVKDKQPWLLLDESVPSFEENYDLKSVWSAENLLRLTTLIKSNERQEIANSDA